MSDLLVSGGVVAGRVRWPAPDRGCCGGCARRTWS